MFSRVFGTASTVPSVAKLVEELHAAGVPAVPHVRGDDLGWTTASLTLPGGGTPLTVDRYLTKEDDLRDDLNTFAAELETMTYSPHHTRLMEVVIQTRQMFVLRRPVDHANEATLDTACEVIGRHLAAATDGVWQIDGRGWLAADGTLLVQEY